MRILGPPFIDHRPISKYFPRQGVCYTVILSSLAHVLFAVALLSVHLTTAHAANDSIILNLNCSDRNWYPFLFVQDDQVKGIFHDIVNKALKELRINAQIYPVPFRRAIITARKGKSDGILAVGYRPDLASFLDYPPAAATDAESEWRILQVDHVVVGVADSKHVFAGDLKTLPEPVRLLQGDPILDDLTKAGITPQEVREDVQNFLKLIRDKKGVVITTSVAAEMMNRDPRFRGRIKIHPTPVASHSYYLAFSKKSRISSVDKLRLWKEIIRLRDDYIFMLQVFSKY